VRAEAGLRWRGPSSEQPRGAPICGIAAAAITLITATLAHASVINPHGSIRILLEDRSKAAIPLVLEFFQEFLSRRDPARDIFLDWLEIPAFVSPP
jgi:hypothetical protein